MGSLLTYQGSHELQLIGAQQLCFIVASLQRAPELQKYVECTSIFLGMRFSFLFYKKAKLTSAEDRISFRWHSASAAAIRLFNDAFATRDQLQFCRSVMCCLELVLFASNDPPCESIFQFTPKVPRVYGHMYSYAVCYGLDIVAFIWSWCRRIM